MDAYFFLAFAFICTFLPIPEEFTLKNRRRGGVILLDTVWAGQQETLNLDKPEILIGAPSSNNLEHMLLYTFDFV